MGKLVEEARAALLAAEQRETMQRLMQRADNERRAKEAAKKSAEVAAAKIADALTGLLHGATVDTVTFEPTCEGVYVLKLADGRVVRFSACGDDATYTTCVCVCVCVCVVENARGGTLYGD